MNLKKTAIALAVATVAATPILASADGSIYASVRYGLESSDVTKRTAATGFDTVANQRMNRTNQFTNFGSRWGIKGETDLGNGMSAFGHWEAHMFDRAHNNANGNDLRDFKVGVKGDFGMVYMGDGIDHAWDTYMTPDVAWWYGGSQKLTDGVQDNAITYMNDFGAFSLAATVAMSDDGEVDKDGESTDQLELAVGFDAGPVNVAVGMTDSAKMIGTDDPDATFGVVVKGEAGGVTYSAELQTGQVEGTVLNYTTASTPVLAGIKKGGADATSYQFEVGMNGFYAQYGVKEVDVAYGTGTDAKVKATENSALVLGYTYNIGPRTLMYFEYRDREFEGIDTTKTTGAVTSEGDSVFAAVLKYDIL